MSRKKIILLGLLGAFVIAAVAGVLAVKINYSAKKEKAVQIAQRYLSQKYEQKMLYSNVNYFWIDPTGYHVIFTPSNNPELYFEVIVQNNLTIAKGLQEFGNSTCPDNYYLRYFEYYTSRQMNKDIQNIWGENAQINVIADDSDIYSHSVPFEINEHMTAKEMETFLKYDFYITTNLLLDSGSKITEAKRMFKLIKVVQKSSYKPTEILFWYKTGKDEKKDDLTDSKTWPEMYIEFGDWSSITTVDQVIAEMDAQYAQWLKD